jgi:membrane protease YdiL (CAAX protease family)
VTRFSTGRLFAWFVLVGVLATSNYVVRFTNSGGQGKSGKSDTLYSYSSALSGLVFYALFFVFVYALAAVDIEELFALRRPKSWHEAAALCIAVLVGIYVWSGIVALLPLPQSPGQEQGLAPAHWQPQYWKAYVANFVVIAIVAPIVEELTFRGVGFALLRRYGLPVTIAVVGVTFGLAHGAIEGLLVFVPLGCALAYVRWRTDSAIPGMIVHALFNAIALLFVLTT